MNEFLAKFKHWIPLVCGAITGLVIIYVLWVLIPEDYFIWALLAFVIPSSYALDVYISKKKIPDDALDRKRADRSDPSRARNTQSVPKDRLIANAWRNRRRRLYVVWAGLLALPSFFCCSRGNGALRYGE